MATGDIAFVPKGQSYTLDEKTSAHLFVVHFESLPDKPQDLEVFKLSGIPWYEEHFKKLHRIWQRKETGYRLSATSVFYRILEEIEKESVKERLHTKNRLMSVVDYIHSSYTDPNLSVSLLSEMYGASPTYFRKIFKANYNTTPIEYITNLRLKRAEELLKSGYYSVSGAAFESGFSDPKYFSRIFKSEKGISPSKLLSTKK